MSHNFCNLTGQISLPLTPIYLVWNLVSKLKTWGFHGIFPAQTSSFQHCMSTPGWYTDTTVLQHFQNTQDLQHTEVQVYLTSKTIRHICFKHNVAENRWKREWFVAFIPKWNVSVTCLQTIQRQDPLTNQLIIVIIYCYSQDSQIRKNNLESHKMKKFND